MPLPRGNVCARAGTANVRAREHAAPTRECVCARGYWECARAHFRVERWWSGCAVSVEVDRGDYHTATKKTTTWLPGPRCLPLDYQCKKWVPLDYQRIEIVPHHYLSVATILLAYQSVPVLPLHYQPHHCICNSVKLLTAQIVPKETT